MSKTHQREGDITLGQYVPGRTRMVRKLTESKEKKVQFVKKKSIIIWLAVRFSVQVT